MRGLICLSVLGLLAGCDCSFETGCDDTIFEGGHGSEDPVTGDGYEAVTGIFEAECTICHSTGGQSPDLSTDLCSTIVGVDSLVWGAPLVAAGDSEGSVLWHKVSDNGVSGGVMPVGGVLDDASLEIIQKWIDDGAECDGSDSSDTDDTDDPGDTDDTDTGDDVENDPNSNPDNTSCELFCSSYETTCATPGHSAAYSDCAAECGVMLLGTSGMALEDSFSCRVFHLLAAGTDANADGSTDDEAAVSCPNAAADGGTLCVGGP